MQDIIDRLVECKEKTQNLLVRLRLTSQGERVNPITSRI